MGHAVVRLDGHPHAPPQWPLTPVAGVPLIERHLMELRRLDFAVVHLACGAQTRTLLREKMPGWQKDHRMPAVRLHASFGQLAAGLSGRILVIDGGYVYHPRLWGQIVSQPSGDLLCCDDQGRLLPLQVMTGAAENRRARREKRPCRTFDASLYVRPAISTVDIAEAEKCIFSHLWKESDGWFSRHLNRPISTAISRRLVGFGIHPNWITFGTLLVGLLSGLLSAGGTYAALAAGGILFQLASILDGVDGELARATFQTSPQGQWLDTVCDDLTNALYLTGVTMGIHRTFHQPAWLWLGVGAIAIYVLTVAFMYWQIIADRQPATLLSFQERVRSPEFQQRRRRLSGVISVLQPLIKRDFYGLAFMAASLAGLAKLIILGWFVGSIATLGIVWKAMGASFLQRIMQQSG